MAIASLYDRRKNGIMTSELTFNELVVESQHLLKFKSGKIMKIPRLVTAKCPHQRSHCQSPDAFLRAQNVAASGDGSYF